MASHYLSFSSEAFEICGYSCKKTGHEEWCRAASRSQWCRIPVVKSPHCCWNPDGHLVVPWGFKGRKLHKLFSEEVWKHTHMIWLISFTNKTHLAACWSTFLLSGSAIPICIILLYSSVCNEESDGQICFLHIESIWESIVIQQPPCSCRI